MKFVIFGVGCLQRAGIVSVEQNSSYFLLLTGEDDDNGRSGCSGVHREEDDGCDSRR